MTKEHKDTLTVRVTSVGFAMLVFVLFRPLGMADLGLSLYLHIAVIWVLGIGGCYVTEAIMKYIVRMPASFDKGVEYIIGRNLRFQLINTPLMALMVCAYLHIFMTAKGLPDPLSWSGYITMLLILAFCSFSIGLYWRFKFRSRYLAAELEETRRLNETIKRANVQALSSTTGSAKPQESNFSGVENNLLSKKATAHSDNGVIILSGNTSDSVTLTIANLLYVESVGNYVKIYHLCDGEVRSDLLRATSKQIEESLKDFATVVRCHRAFLVNLGQVEKIVSQSGNIHLLMKHTHDTLPVSRSNTAKVKSAFSLQ